MEKKIILLFVCLISTIALKAQIFEWAKSFGGPVNYDIGNSISTDASGNIYTTGNFGGTADFDPGTGISNHTSAGSNDVFIQKMDALGNFLWAKSFGGINNDIGRSIKIDASGNVYIAGFFNGTVDFDPGTGITNLTSLGNTDVFIQKMDALGNFLWAKSFGGTSNETVNAMSIDTSGNVYTVGSFYGTADFDPGLGISNLISVGDNDIFVQKMDASGNFLWAKSFGGISIDAGSSISIDLSGDIYTTGYFDGTVDFDPGIGITNHTSLGNLDVFVQKMDASGNFLWAKPFGGVLSEGGSSISIDASGGVYTTGFFAGTADFDPGTGITNLTAVAGNDIFVQKMDASGNFLWAKSFGGSNLDFSRFINIDASGNVYTIGRFKGTADFDPGTGVANFTSVAGNDVFIQKMNASGNFLWAKSFGGAGYDVAHSISIDASGNLYTIGNFEGTVDFDPGAGVTNLTTTGVSFDVFIQKMSACHPTSGIDIITACNSYQWIDSNTYTTSNNTAMDTILNAAGCDSVITLDLTINYSNNVADIITACDSYQWIDGNTYTTSNNTATDTLQNLAGCDSVITLDLTINSVSDITTSLNSVTITASNTMAAYQWLDCDNNYSQISGETNQLYSATENGNYAVELTENGCVDTSFCVSITIVGILENNFGNDFILYPNPNDGNFSIDLGNAYQTTIVTITDLSGKIIQSKIFNDIQLLSLKLEESAGVYMVIIESENKKALVKLVKE